MKRILPIAGLGLLASLSAAQTFNIYADFAPNFFGSPSYDAFEANFFQGISTGATTVGDPNSPTGYQNVIGGTFDGRRNVASSFGSFDGVADSTSAERGNRLTFGLNLVFAGAANAFTLADLEEGTESSIPDSEGFDLALLSFDGASFNSTRVGIFYGADGVRGGTDDITYSSDVAGVDDDTLLINEISLIASGVANEATAATPGATDQDRIDFAGAEYGAYTLNGIFRLRGGSIQSAGVNFQPVPEPATMAALGLGALALLRRRRASK